MHTTLIKLQPTLKKICWKLQFLQLQDPHQQPESIYEMLAIKQPMRLSATENFTVSWKCYISAQNFHQYHKSILSKYPAYFSQHGEL